MPTLVLAEGLDGSLRAPHLIIEAHLLALKPFEGKTGVAKPRTVLSAWSKALQHPRLALAKASLDPSGISLVLRLPPPMVAVLDAQPRQTLDDYASSLGRLLFLGAGPSDVPTNAGVTTLNVCNILTPGIKLGDVVVSLDDQITTTVTAAERLTFDPKHFAWLEKAFRAALAAQKPPPFPVDPDDEADGVGAQGGGETLVEWLYCPPRNCPPLKRGCYHLISMGYWQWPSTLMKRPQT